MMKLGRAAAVVLVAAALIAAPMTAQAAATTTPAKVGFTLNAKVLEGGEQVVSVTLDTSRIGKIDAKSLSAGTFTVHAKATSPVTIGTTDAMYSLYDADRVISAVGLTKSGDVEITFTSGPTVSAASVLGYYVPGGSLGNARNVMLNLAYQITQNSAFTLANGKSVTISSFVQGKLSDPEVDAFRYGTNSGLKYRLFTPSKTSAKQALIVWLHGNGEGGLGTTYYSDEPPLRANRGALGMASKDAQKIFGGAYVVAPEVPDTWYNIDTAGYAPKLKALIDSIVKKHKINTKRIYVMGASAGGMMAMQMESRYPKFFAAAAVSSPALYVNRDSDYKMTEAQVLAVKTTPTWLVQSKADTTVDFTKSSVWAYDLLKPFGKVVFTPYDTVTWQGVTYNGHWSWVYTAHDDPSINTLTAEGNSKTTHVWEWMASKKR